MQILEEFDIISNLVSLPKIGNVHLKHYGSLKVKLSNPKWLYKLLRRELD